MKGLNLSTFKKISSDKNTTTLQHEDGHQLKIMHSALPHLQRKALEKLPMHKGQESAQSDAGKPVPMAKGGEVNNTLSPDNALNQYVPGDGIVGGTIYDGSEDEKFLFGEYCFDIDKARSISQKQPNAEIPVSKKWIDKIKLNKEAAIKSTSTNPVFLAQVHTPNGIKPLLIDGNHRMFKAVQDGKETVPAYIFSPEQTASLFVPKPEGVLHPEDEKDAQMFAKGGQVKRKMYKDGTPGEPVSKDDVAPSESQDPIMAGLQNAGNALKPATDYIADKAATYLNAGVPTAPGASPAIPDSAAKPEDASAQSPTQITDTPNQPPPAGDNKGISPLAAGMNTEADFQQGLKGLQEKATVEAQAAKDRAEIMGNTVDSERDLLYNAQQKSQEYQQHEKQAFQDYLDGHIKPNHYLQDMGTTGKVTTAIGLLLGGFSAPFTGQGNPAMDFLNKQIDRDIAAQKENQGERKTLLDANRALYQDDVTADANTRIQLNNMTLHKIALAADKQGTPAAKAAYDQAASQFSLQNAGLRQSTAMRAAVLAEGSKAPLSAKIQYGLPQDQQAEAQKQASEYDSYLRAKQNVNMLMNQLDKEQTTGNLVNPQSYNRVNQIKAQIVQAIMETSPSKRLTKESIEAEIKPLEYSTGATQKTRDAAKSAVNQLVDVHAGPMNILQDNGFIPKIGAQTSMGRDEQALQWANANPKNPKAAQIKQKLGIK